MSMPDVIGNVVDGRYELLSMLGSGTFGVVYKALDLKADTSSSRAIKIIPKAYRSPWEIEAVRREVELQSLVTGYPNIVGIHDAFENDHYSYLVLDLCLGGDLFHQICCQKAYAHNDEQLRTTFLQLVGALETCHEANIFHRDLKPENILTNLDGSEIFLADFGLATRCTMTNEHGCGTEIYMSPEAVGHLTDRKPYNARFADIWALGVILINMITGRQPWTIASPDDCCFSRWLEDSDYLKRMLPISDGANLIIQRMFRLEPTNRITLTELRQEITELYTFFLTPDESAKASNFGRCVPADSHQPRVRRAPRRPFRRPPPRSLHLPKLQDIQVRTESSSASPIPSLTGQREFDIPVPQRYYTAVEGNCSTGYAPDQSASEASS